MNIKKRITIILSILLPIFLVSIIIYAATFPGALTEQSTGDVIEAEDWNAIEATIGTTDSASSTSLTYLITNTSSKLGKIASLAVTDGNFIIANGTTWVAESGATARTSMGLGSMATETATDYLTVIYASSTYLQTGFASSTYLTQSDYFSTTTWAGGTQALTTTGAGNFATINTGQGAYELYNMNQNVHTFAEPTFAELSVGDINFSSVGADVKVDNASAGFPGGDLSLIAGRATSGQEGGDLYIIAGAGISAAGGDVLIMPGGAGSLFGRVGIGTTTPSTFVVMGTSTAFFVIDGAGNIGIATSTPDYLLTVGATTGSNFIIDSAGNTTTTSSFNVNNNFRVDSSGNLIVDGGIDINLPANYNITIDGRTNPRTVTVGAMRWNHTPDASTPNTRALFLDIDANSVPNTQGMHINLMGTLIAAGETVIALDIVGDTANSSGGVLRLIELDKTGVGSAEVHGIHIEPEIEEVIHHASGTFIDPTQGWDENGGFTSTTHAFSSSTLNVTMFDADNDAIYIGADAVFQEIEYILDTAASNPGIKPTFEIWTGSAWTTITPVDGTAGFRESGVIDLEDTDLSSWAASTTNGVSKFYLQITRTQNSLGTDPIESLIQTAAVVDYIWDKDGNLNISQLTIDNYGVSAATGTFSGVLTSATLNTGQGAYELYAMNQNVLTTSQPTFNGLTITFTTTTDATTTNLYVSGILTATLTGNADTATALASNPTDCSSNQFANAINASGDLTCAAIGDADVPNDITINSTSDITTTSIASSTAITVNDLFEVGSDGNATSTQFEITNGTNGVRIIPGATTTLEFF